MTDDLVKRLHWHRDFIGTNPWPDGYPFLREVRDRLGDAADRIEQLVATNEQLTAERDKWKTAFDESCNAWQHTCEHEMDRADKAEAERDIAVANLAALKGETP